MGVGTPRVGLRPGVGRRPGRNAAAEQAIRRLVEFPGDDVFPGRATYTTIHWATVPSLTLYPSTSRLIRGAPEVFNRTLTSIGSGALTSLSIVSRRLVRRLLAEGQPDVTSLSTVGLGPGFELTRLPVSIALRSELPVKVRLRSTVPVSVGLRTETPHKVNL